MRSRHRLRGSVTSVGVEEVGVGAVEVEEVEVGVQVEVAIVRRLKGALVGRPTSIMNTAASTAPFLAQRRHRRHVVVVKNHSNDSHIIISHHNSTIINIIITNHIKIHIHYINFISNSIFVQDRNRRLFLGRIPACCRFYPATMAKPA